MKRGNAGTGNLGMAIGLIALLLIGSSFPIEMSGGGAALAEVEPFGGFIMEMPLDEAEQMDAIRYLQARIVQPYSDNRYFVRGVRVLLPAESNVGVFAYLVTFQTNVPENRAYDIGDFYSVASYYLLLLIRSGDELSLIDEISLTPSELADRLGVSSVPPPELVANPDDLDFTDAVFDTTDPALVEWRERLVEYTVPRWEWVDLTGDGRLDLVLDIEGFEFQPTSYYTIMVSTDNWFVEGFRSWGYDTDFSEFEDDGEVALRDERYAVSAKGSWLPRWRDYFKWNGERFALANMGFAEDYTELIPALEQLASESLETETTPGSRWEGLPRYAINATRYSEGLGAPFEYYFNLARIAEYQGNPAETVRWWRTLVDYVNEEYDSQIAMGIEELNPAIRDVVLAYEEWRDELYAAAEAALEE